MLLGSWYAAFWARISAWRCLEETTIFPGLGVYRVLISFSQGFAPLWQPTGERAIEGPEMTPALEIERRAKKERPQAMSFML